MKFSYAHRYRRHTPTSRESTISKKDNQSEHTFFAAPSNQSFFKPNTVIQRKCAHCEGEDKQIKRMNAPEEKKMHKKEDKELHRTTDHKEDDKKLARKEATQSDTTSTYIHSLGGKGQSLPDNAQHFFGERMEHDFSGVKVHTGTEAAQSAKAVNAKAYTVDDHIVFNKGQYNPSSHEGKKLLAHELAHVVQNNGSSVNRKVQGSGKEKESDVAITGTAARARSKKAHGQCEGVQVDGLTEFTPLPSSFSTKGKTKPSDVCDACTPPECISSKGTITSTFKSTITITLPDVPSGFSKCETKAVKKFIRTTLKPHEEQHKAAFKKYNGTVKTPYEYTGCKSGLTDYIQSIHNDLDTQRSTDAIAASDALDPFVRPIPCNCD